MLTDIGTLFSRMALGASIAAHGAQKAWGAFEGPGPVGAAGFMESLGFVPGERYATAASRTELVSGLLIALGLGGPVGPAALISTMLVAQSSVHAKNGFFAQKNGVELGVLYSTAALALASGGYGSFSIDEAFGWKKLREPGFVALTLAVAVAAALVVLGQRAELDVAPSTGSSSVDSGVATGAASVPEPSTIVRSSEPAQADPLAATQSHIEAAIENRPVPADLLLATDESAGA